MNVLVTGGLGFIGSHLCAALVERGHTVVALSNRCHPQGLGTLPKVIVAHGDVRYLDDLAPFMPRIALCYHLAALINVDQSAMNPQAFYDTNVAGTLNVLEACKKNGVKFVYASSSEVYGSAQSETMDETHPIAPQSLYGSSKAAADLLVQTYGRTYDINWVTLRPFNTSGPGQSAGSGLSENPPP